jgi:long-subunit fatty acid transport protein
MRKLAFSAGLVAVTLSGAAFGSGYYVPKIGGDTAGPTSANGSALFWNPAAMSLIDGHSVFLEGNSVYRKNTFQTTEIDPNTNRPYAESVNERWNFIPAVATTFTLHERIKAGLGVFVPYGMGNDTKPLNGPQRFSIIYADLRSIWVTPSVSIDLYQSKNSRLAAAYGIIYAYTSLDHYKALDSRPIVSNGATPAGSTVAGVPVGSEARVRFKGDGHNVSYDIGLLYQYGPAVFGASYIHSMEAKLKGTLQSYLQSTTLDTAPGLGKPMDATVNFSLPSTARIGAEYRIADGRAVVKIQADWSNWSEFKMQDIKVTPPADVKLNLDQHYARNYKDAFGARLGGSYFVHDMVEVLLAGGFETAAVPDKSMTPEINDAALIGLSAGPKIYLGKGPKNWLNRRDQRTGVFGKHDALIIHLLYNPLIYMKRDVKGTTTLPAADGTYKTIVHMIDLNLDYRF